MTQTLLLNCISAFLRGERLTAPEDTDWQTLIRLARQQKLLPMVFEALGGAMPEELRRAVKTEAVREVAAQTRRTAAFLEACRALNEAGIYPLAVKGIVCRSVYSKPDFRVSADEDLYIPLEEYPVFHAKMLELGFCAEEPDYENAHELRYTRNGLLIEGHWELFPRNNTALNAMNTLTEALLSRAERSSALGAELLTLDDTGHMIFLLLHAFKHFINSGVGIRQICDVALWSEARDIDWQRVKKAVSGARAECFCSAVFDAGERYFGMSFPEGCDRADCTGLIADALDGGIYGASDMNRRHSGSITLGAFENSGGVPAMKALFPNRSVMELNYPWVKSSALLLPAAWCARIVRYVFGEKESSAAESLKIGAERLELLKHYKIIP